MKRDAPSPGEPPRLGLALAGGGFRASLFHLGVLHRLAELDLLRSVHLLSTVSGGSITGALYALLLKRELEAAPDGDLDRDGYVKLVRELDDHLTAAIRKNLRTRLLRNPVRVLGMLLTGRNLAGEMARQYERHLFRDVVAGMDLPARAGSGVKEERRGGGGVPGAAGGGRRPGEIGLREIRIHPGGGPLAGGITAHNRARVARGGSAVTALVMNATSLNSGRIFRFSSSELGDPELGFVRYDEIPILEIRKALLEALQGGDEEAAEALELPGVRRGAPAGDDAVPSTATPSTAPPSTGPPSTGLPSTGPWIEPSRIRSLARWLLERNAGTAVPPPAPPAGWEALFVEGSPFPTALADASPGPLRSLKNAALARLKGDLSAARCREAILAELERMDEALADAAKPHLPPEEGAGSRESGGGPEGGGDPEAGGGPEGEPEPGTLLLEFLVELYWLESARRVSHTLLDDWHSISLADAVGASACFPPIFPPYRLRGIYDDAHVSRLGLTDGGVYDNMGITTLIEEGCDYIITSDTSGLFHREQQVATGRLGLLGRLQGIVTHGLAENQREGLRERRRVSRSLSAALMEKDLPSGARRTLELALGARTLHGLAYFHIDSPPVHPDHPPGSQASGPALAPLRRAIAGLRTDLDGFGEVEVAALVNHGYDTADRYIRKFLGDLSNEHWTPPAGWPRPLPGGAARSLPGGAARPLPGGPARPLPVADAGEGQLDDAQEWERWERILAVGRHRFFRSLRLGSPVSLGATAVVLAALGYLGYDLLWRSGLTLAVILHAGAGRLLDLLGAGLPWVGAFWLDDPGVVRVAVVALVAIAAARILLAAKAPVRHLRRRRMAWARRIARLAMRLRNASGNLGWLVGWLPVALALGASVVALASHTLFYLPFRRRTEVRQVAPRGPEEGDGG